MKSEKVVESGSSKKHKKELFHSHQNSFIPINFFGNCNQF